MSGTPAHNPRPLIDLRHLVRMTDDTGLFQHAKYHVPDAEHGYCIDDNARALIAAVLYEHLHRDGACAALLDRYLAFVVNALNPDGAFRNFMGYDRRWLEEVGSPDSHARALWSLGVTIRYAKSERVVELAEVIFDRALSVTESYEHVHPIAYTLIAIHERLVGGDDHAYATQLQQTLANRLWTMWQANAVEDWPWPTDVLTWGNAKIPHALLIAGKALGREDMVDAALKSLRWCLDVQTTEDGHLSVIGNDGWFTRTGHRAQFDQQAIEAQCLAQAALAAHEATDDARWIEAAYRCYAWFHGQNDLGLSLIDPETGGIYDGIHPDGLNKNQGAESYLAHLLAALELQLLERSQPHHSALSVTEHIGFAVIGASKFASFCLDHYRTIEGLQPIAVWSRTHDSARRFADRHDLTAHEDLSALLDDPAIELVHIATTPATHADLATRAIQSGKHVLIDKPIATSMDDADRLTALAEQHERHIAVNLMMRYGPLVEPIYTLILSGELGAPLRGGFTNHAGDSGLPLDHWFWDRAQSGGIFIEHGVHSFDLAQHYLGPGSAISAHHQLRPETSIVDQCAAEVRFGQQATLSFYHGFTQADGMDHQRLSILFERGELVLDGWIANEMTLNAVLSNDQVEQIAAMLPGVHIETRQKYEPGTVVRRRGREEAAHGLFRIVWSSPQDKQTLYGQAVHDLMADFMLAISNPAHTMRLTPRDATAALRLAMEADNLATQSD